MNFIDVKKPISTYTISKDQILKIYYITGEDRVFYGINDEKPRTIRLQECAKGKYFRVNYRCRYYLHYFTPCSYKE